MTNIFEIFNPNDRHWREQKDFDKVHVYTTKKGGRGPMQVDLDDKTIVLPTRSSADPESDKPIKRGSQRAKQSSDEKAGDELAGGDQPDEQAADEAKSAGAKKSGSREAVRNRRGKSGK